MYKLEELIGHPKYWVSCKTKEQAKKLLKETSLKTLTSLYDAKSWEEYKDFTIYNLHFSIKSSLLVERDDDVIVVDFEQIDFSETTKTFKEMIEEKDEERLRFANKLKKIDFSCEDVELFDYERTILKSIENSVDVLIKMLLKTEK